MTSPSSATGWALTATTEPVTNPSRSMEPPCTRRKKSGRRGNQSAIALGIRAVTRSSARMGSPAAMGPATVSGRSSLRSRMFRGLPGCSSIQPFFMSAVRWPSTVELFRIPIAAAISGREGATPCSRT